jgi:hypothetical protein
MKICHRDTEYYKPHIINELVIVTVCAFVAKLTFYSKLINDTRGFVATSRCSNQFQFEELENDY